MTRKVRKNLFREVKKRATGGHSVAIKLKIISEWSSKLND